MSGVFKTVNKGFDSIFGTHLGGSGKGKAAVAAPAAVDESQQSSQELDRIRRRKGVLSNIFAGDTSAPAVGTKTLTGQ